MRHISRVFKFDVKRLEKDLFVANDYCSYIDNVKELRCNWLTAIVWAGIHEKYLHNDMDPMTSDGMIIGTWGGTPIVVDNTIASGCVEIVTE